MPLFTFNVKQPLSKSPEKFFTCTSMLRMSGAGFYSSKVEKFLVLLTVDFTFEKLVVTLELDVQF